MLDPGASRRASSMVDATTNVGTVRVELLGAPRLVLAGVEDHALDR